LWIVPNLNIAHYSRKTDPQTKEYVYSAFPGNFHEFLLRQPGGSKSANPIPPKFSLPTAA
jgi:hypothetical protein